MTPAQHIRHRGNRFTTPWYVAFAALALSVVAFVVTFREGKVLLYSDAISRLEIARRVIDGSTPSAAQFGGVWLPGTHILMLSLVWNNTLYHNGVAGAVFSMLAYVLATVLVYKIVLQLTGRKFAAVAGAAVFALNINILYMQSTPMTELPLYAALLGLLYGVQKWIDTYDYRYLMWSALAGIFASLVRYEAWFIMIALLPVVAYAAWRRDYGHVDTNLPKEQLREATLNLQRRRRGLTSNVVWFFVLLAFAGVGGWLVWNQIIFGNFLNFQSGEYAKPALWLTNSEPSIGNWWVSLKTFYYAVTGSIPWPLLIAAAVGLVAMLVLETRHGKHPGRAWVTMSTLIMVPFFIWALYSGQRPIHVQQVNHGLYNVRFGLILVLPVAIGVGYLVALLGRIKGFGALMANVVLLVALLLGASALKSGNIITMQDPASAKGTASQLQNEAADHFKQLYDRGDILMETFGNEEFDFTLPSSHLVYEGTNAKNRWNRALSNPDTAKIRWVIMRCQSSSPDKVCRALNGKPNLANEYDLEWSNQNYQIYKHR